MDNSSSHPHKYQLFFGRVKGIKLQSNIKNIFRVKLLIVRTGTYCWHLFDKERGIRLKHQIMMVRKRAEGDSERQRADGKKHTAWWLHVFSAAAIETIIPGSHNIISCPTNSR